MPAEYLIVSTSLRPASLSRILGLALAKELDGEHLDLRDFPLPLCDGDAAYGDPNVEILRAKIEAARVILLAVPMAVLGALGAVAMRGMPNDVYCQIGLLMLIGLSAKNSILIVEFAEQIREHGKSIIEAAIEAAELRLRPILMTSFAFILGILPLCFAEGAGSLGRRSVGTTIVGGMLVSTLLNIFFIPALYVILRMNLERITRKSRRQERLPAVAER